MIQLLQSVVGTFADTKTSGVKDRTRIADSEYIVVNLAFCTSLESLSLFY